jgi:hypothetical protein
LKIEAFIKEKIIFDEQIHPYLANLLIPNEE